MRFKLFLLLLCLVATSKNSSAQSFNKRKMDSLMAILAAKNKVMLSIALCQNGKIAYSNPIGNSSIETNDKTKS